MRVLSQRVVFVLLLVGFLPVPGVAQQADSFFRQNCVSCHTIGRGKLTGPDLKDVSNRQDRDWLIRFVINPKAVIDSGDPYARDMLQQSRNVVMPTVFGMTSDLAGALIDLIDEQSLLPVSEMAGPAFNDRPFTPEDIVEGIEIFRGTDSLRNDGPACISCHTMKGLGGLSGGRLGPDLTRVYERLQGRTALAMWLFAPATTRMQPLFRDHPLEEDEILALVATFEAAAREGGEDDSVATLSFLFWALGGTVPLLMGFDAVWKFRFRAVRKPLIRKDGLNKS